MLTCYTVGEAHAATCLHACMPLHACTPLHACMPGALPTDLPTYEPTYLPTYLQGLGSLLQLPPLSGRFLLGMLGMGERRHLGKAVGVGQAAVQVCGEE